MKDLLIICVIVITVVGALDALTIVARKYKKQGNKMKLKENYIRQDSVVKFWYWGQYKDKLKYEYKNEHEGEVKTYKMSKKELEEYLKKYSK